MICSEFFHSFLERSKFIPLETSQLPVTYKIKKNRYKQPFYKIFLSLFLQSLVVLYTPRDLPSAKGNGVASAIFNPYLDLIAVKIISCHLHDESPVVIS